MRFLRQNTAVIVTVGPFCSNTDGVTLQTALTIANEKISFTVDLDEGSPPTLVLDNVTGATSGTSNDLNYITNNDAALMQLELAAANVNHVGRAFLTINDAAHHCPVFHEFEIMSQQAYDSFFGTDTLQVDLIQILGTTLTETAGYLAAGFKKFFNVATPVHTVASVDQTGDSYASVGALGGDGTVMEQLSGMNGVLVGVQTMANQFTDMTEYVSSHYRFTSAALTQAWAVTTRAVTDKANFTLSTAGILAIWHQALSAIVTSSTIGKLLKDNIDATVSSRAPESAGNIAAIKAKTDALPAIWCSP